MSDDAEPRVVRVTFDQVSAARALIRLRGGEEHVDADIVKIAHAESDREPEYIDGKEIVRVSDDQISAARALIHLNGGEEHVDPDIVKIAHAETMPEPGRERGARTAS